MHILIIRFSSLGDIILASSLPAAIKKRHGENVRISFLTSKAFVPLVENMAGVDQVYSFSRKKGIAGLKELARDFKAIYNERKVDLIIDMHSTLRSLFLRFRFPYIPRIYVDKRTFERGLLTTFKIDCLSDQNQKEGSQRKAGFGELLLQRNIRDFSPLFDLEDVSEVSHFVDEKKDQGQLSSCSVTYDDFPYNQIMKTIGLEKKKFIVYVPSASFPEKRWPVDRFVELLEKTLEDKRFEYYQHLVLAGPDDDFCRVFDYLEDKYPDRFYNLQGKTSLTESAQLVKDSLYCLGNDTGLPHIAESVGTPALFILGPTGEEFGFYPHLKDSEVICKKLWCRPCTTNGKGNCIRSERFCLTDISVNEVFDRSIQMLGKF